MKQRNRQRKLMLIVYQDSLLLLKAFNYVILGDNGKNDKLNILLTHDEHGQQSTLDVKLPAKHSVTVFLASKILRNQGVK